jgi:hypothetical protein
MEISICIFLFLILIGIFLLFYKNSNNYFLTGIKILFCVVFLISPFLFYEGRLRWWLFWLGIAFLLISLFQEIIKKRIFKKFFEVIGELLSTILSSLI